MIKLEKPSPMLVVVLLVAVLADVVLWWPDSIEQLDTRNRFTERISLIPLAMEATPPVPNIRLLDNRKIALGRKLFHDKRLSADDTIACSHCHNLDAGGVDGLVHSVGIGGAQGGINAPTVFNSGFNFVQFWDGRAATLEDQIDGPVNNPLEMGANWKQVVEKLGRDGQYLEQFHALYSDGITPTNIKDAIATFERSLSTPDSRFDSFLNGDVQALAAREQKGYELFRRYGCVACHQGVNLGGNMYQQMGLMGDYFGDRGNPTQADLGRFNVTGDPADRHYFKVPTLRNIALTAPYFHDGSAKTLEQAVTVMAKYQLGRKMPEEDVQAIVAFLGSLTGHSAEHQP